MIWGQILDLYFYYLYSYLIIIIYISILLVHINFCITFCIIYCVMWDKKIEMKRYKVRYLSIPINYRFNSQAFVSCIYIYLSIGIDVERNRKVYPKYFHIFPISLSFSYFYKYKYLFPLPLFLSHENNNQLMKRTWEKQMVGNIWQTRREMGRYKRERIINLWKILNNKKTAVGEASNQ